MTSDINPSILNRFNERIMKFLSSFWSCQLQSPIIHTDMVNILCHSWASAEQFSGVGKLYSVPGKRLFKHFSFPNSYSN